VCPKIQIVAVVVNQFERQHSEASLPRCLCERKPWPEDGSPVPATFKNRNQENCGNLFVMRRMQAIFVIVALLSTPLALLARTSGTDAMACNDGMCCLPHGPHHSAAHHTPRGSAHDSMSCEHGAASHIIECTMKAGQHRMDYGLLSPIAPTKPSALASITPLNLPRVAGFQSPGQGLAAGFLANPFQPPRT
jgi:hypothetical protein